MDRLSPFFQGRGQFRSEQWNNFNNVVSNQAFVPNQVVQTNYRQEGFVPNPVYTAPVYTPVYNAPQYTAPVDNTPVYTAPVYTAPVYTPVVDNTPVYTQTYPTKEYRSH